MKIRSKATLTLRAMLARRYGFGDVYKRQAKYHVYFREQVQDELREIFEAQYEPVSYTHLDVYKRQLLPYQ